MSDWTTFVSLHGSWSLILIGRRICSFGGQHLKALLSNPHHTLQRVKNGSWCKVGFSLRNSFRNQPLLS
jgi:hypothetical protein